MHEEIEQLTNMFKNHNWFHSIGIDQYGRYVIYTHFMCKEIFDDIPDFMFGKQVIIHFASSKMARLENFITNVNLKSFSKSESIPTSFEKMLPDIDESSASSLENDIDYLISELSRLRKICNPNNLDSIFYEEHDGKNAVTNLSIKFPEVREAMGILYNIYGFDLIYDNI